MRREPDDYGWVLGLVFLACFADLPHLPWLLGAGVVAVGVAFFWTILLPEVRIALAQRRLRREEAVGAARVSEAETVTNPADFSRLDWTVHPVGVYNWFVNPDPDLQTDENQAPLSPRDWLRSGRSPELVAELASALGKGL